MKKPTTSNKPFLPVNHVETMQLSTLVNKLNTNVPESENGEKEKLDMIGLSIPSPGKDIFSKLKAIQEMLEIHPDLDLSVELMVSTTISPNDMNKTALKYGLNSNVNLPVTVIQQLVSLYSSYLDDDFLLPKKAPRILSDSKYYKGGVVTLVIPENKIAEIMSGEGETAKIALESGLLDSGDVNISGSIADIDIEFTSDLSELNLAKFKRDTDDFALESGIYAGDIGTGEKKFLENLFTKTGGKDKTFIELTENGLNMDGQPLIQEVSITSIAPVFKPGSPSDHIGYFYFVDENGAGITGEFEEILETDDGSTDLGSYIKGTNAGNSEGSKSRMDTVVAKAKTALGNMQDTSSATSNPLEAFSYLFDKAIKEKLNISTLNGTAAIEIDDVNDLYNIMFQRYLASKRTKVIFIPKVYVSYIAFDYRKNGTGKPLLEKLLPIAGLASVMVMANVNANVRNAIPGVQYTAEIPDSVLDKEAEMTRILANVLKVNQHEMPTSLNGIADLTDWLSSVGISVRFTGNGIPAFSIDKEVKNPRLNTVDSETIKYFTNKLITAIGPRPEMVSAAANDVDFAASIIANNAYLARKASKIADEFMPQLAELGWKLLIHNGNIKQKALDIFKENKVKILAKINDKTSDKTKMKIEDEDSLFDWLFTWTCKQLTVDIPDAEVYENKNLKEAFASYSEEISDGLDLIFSSDVMPSDLFGELGDMIDPIKETLKGTAYREWMANNSYLPIISNMLKLNADGEVELPMLDDGLALTKTLKEAIIPYLKDMKKQALKNDEKLEKIEDMENEPDPEPEPTTPVEETPADDSTTEDEIPDTPEEETEDLGGSDDELGDDTPSEEEGMDDF